MVPRRGRWAVLSGLIFFVAPGLGLVGNAEGPRLGGGLAALALFVLAYCRLMIGGGWPGPPADAEDRPAVSGVLVLVALTGVLIAIGTTDWAGMWCFVAAATGLRIERRQAFPALFAVGAAAAGTEALNTSDAATIVSLFIVAVGVGMLTAGFRRLRVVNVELGQARDEIGRLAVADERLRFARDLHDLLGHSLSVVALKSELAARLIDEHPDQAAAHVRDIEAVSRRALAEVRDAVAGYRRPLLSAELAGARSTLAAAGIEVEAGPAPEGELPPDAEAVLAWAVREGATNVLRHADAHRVRISVAVDDRDAALELVDDGCGAPAGGADGTGLAGLAERVARVRGRMDAAPGATGGFRLAVTVPLEAAS
ncbi:sensor histidine kinase [Baekduia soli]|uniref:sensor histidine kinase n=1 Tax=Baekduia soli TaxID=496014 RepID=UPI0016522F76|nr:sensor histidine kinase [Baekduia soli]